MAELNTHIMKTENKIHQKDSRGADRAPQKLYTIRGIDDSEIFYSSEVEADNLCEAFRNRGQKTYVEELRPELEDGNYILYPTSGGWYAVSISGVRTRIITDVEFEWDSFSKSGWEFLEGIRFEKLPAANDLTNEQRAMIISRAGFSVIELRNWIVSVAY